MSHTTKNYFSHLALLALITSYSLSSLACVNPYYFKVAYSREIYLLEKYIKHHKDFPKPGIMFADFLPILRDPKAFHLCIDLLYEKYKSSNIDVVVGLESRGFLIGVPLAMKLGVGFVPLRKAGKIPGQTISINYSKEYGTDTLEIASDSITPGQRVLLVDDLLATGGTAKAAVSLIKKANAIPVEFATILQVRELAEKVHLEIPWFNLID